MIGDIRKLVTLMIVALFCLGMKAQEVIVGQTQYVDEANHAVGAYTFTGTDHVGIERSMSSANMNYYQNKSDKSFYNNGTAYSTTDACYYRKGINTSEPDESQWAGYTLRIEDGFVFNISSVRAAIYVADDTYTWKVVIKKGVKTLWTSQLYTTTKAATSILNENVTGCSNLYGDITIQLQMSQAGSTKYFTIPYLELTGTSGTDLQPKYKVDVRIADDQSSWGSVLGSGNYHESDEVSISAIANKGYEFDYWTTNINGNDGERIDGAGSVYTFQMPQKQDYTSIFTAHFKQKYSVTYTKDEDTEGPLLPVEYFLSDGSESWTVPQNRTLYKEGYTLIGWKDQNQTLYTNGDVVPISGSLTVQPEFRKNKVTLADRTSAAIIRWELARNEGAPSYAFQQAQTILVTQANINNEMIDVKMDIDALGGKFANDTRLENTQINKGTKIYIPSDFYATVTMGAQETINSSEVDESLRTAIDGSRNYAEGLDISYVVQSTNNPICIDFGDDGHFYSYIQIMLPKNEPPTVVTDLDEEYGCVLQVPTTLSVTFDKAQSYQWYRNVGPSTAGAIMIEGATSNTLNYVPTVKGVEYVYCVASNASGFAYSRFAKMNIVAQKPSITFDAENETVSMRMNGGDPNAMIYYVIDYMDEGIMPTSASTRYTGPFQPVANATVRAIAVSDGGVASEDTAVVVAYPEDRLCYVSVIGDQHSHPHIIPEVQDNSYLKGATIQIEADVDEGFQLSNWTNNYGEFDEVFANPVNYTVPLNPEGVSFQISSHSQQKNPHTVTFNDYNDSLWATFSDVTDIRVPAYYTLYREGYTLQKWAYTTQTSTDYYNIGRNYSISYNASEITLKPVYEVNNPLFEDRLNFTSIKWDFCTANNAQILDIDKGKEFDYVAQADVDGNMQDVAMHIKNSTRGKFSNTDVEDWCTFKRGTILTVPSSRGSVIRMETFSELSTTTIAGEVPTDYFMTDEGTYVYYYYTKNDDRTADIVIGDDETYYRFVQVDLQPVIITKSVAVVDTWFQDWNWSGDEVALTGGTSTVRTLYADKQQDFTLTLQNASLSKTATNDQYFSIAADPYVTGYILADKTKSAMVTSSVINNVTRVRYYVGTTAVMGETDRGWTMEYSADGGNTWTVADDSYVSGTDGMGGKKWIDIIFNQNGTAAANANSTDGTGMNNVMLRWINRSGSQNAYMFGLEIYGNIRTAERQSYLNLSQNISEAVAGSVYVWPKVAKTDDGMQYNEGQQVRLLMNNTHEACLVDWKNADDNTTITSDNPYTFNITGEKVNIMANLRELHFATVQFAQIDSLYFIDPIEQELGTTFTVPYNHLYYKPGYTVKYWTDQDGNRYDFGTVCELKSNITLSPMFEENEVTLADLTDSLTVRWKLSMSDMGKIFIQGWSGGTQHAAYIVTQAAVAGDTIDFGIFVDAEHDEIPSTKPDGSTTKGKGKFDNHELADGIQIRNNTWFSFPATNGVELRFHSLQQDNTFPSYAYDHHNVIYSGKEKAEGELDNPSLLSITRKPSNGRDIYAENDTATVIVAAPYSDTYDYIEAVYPAAQPAPKISTNEVLLLFLRIKPEEENATSVWYTTDGTVPSKANPENGSKLPSGGATLYDQKQIIRAIAYSDDRGTSNVTTIFFKYGNDPTDAQLTSLSYVRNNRTTNVDISDLNKNKTLSLNIGEALTAQGNMPVFTAKVNNAGTVKIIQPTFENQVVEIHVYNADEKKNYTTYLINLTSSGVSDPKLTSTDYVCNEFGTGVCLNLHFDKEMLESTIEDFTLTAQDGTTVVQTINIHTGSTLSFNLWELAPNTTYSYSIPATTFMSTAGLRYRSDISGSFTTTPAPKEDNTSPEWFIVGKDGTLAEALALADSHTGKSRRLYIYIPNGEYQLTAGNGITVNTGKNKTALNCTNVSFIGESKEKTIIYNTPVGDAGIEDSWTLGFTNTSGGNNFLQNLTLRNNYDYLTYTGQTNPSTEARYVIQAPVFVDLTNRTILDNVALRGYEDTYYSKSADRSYFRNCDISGVLHILRGYGDAWFENTNITLRSRNIVNVAAPMTLKSQLWGFVLNNTTFNKEANNTALADNSFTLGIPTTECDNNASPAVTYLHNKYNIAPSATGWTNTISTMTYKSNLLLRFHEYDSRNANDSPTDLSQRSVQTFTPASGSDNVVLSTLEAADYTLHNVLGGNEAYDPEEYLVSRPQPAGARVDEDMMSWTNDANALCWLVFQRLDNGTDKCVGVAEENSFDLLANRCEQGFYFVRAANGRGVLSEPSIMVNYRPMKSYELNIQLTGSSEHYGWSTIYLDYNAKEPDHDHLAIYAATRIEPSAVHLKRVDILNANQGYVCYGEAPRNYLFREVNEPSTVQSLLSGVVRTSPVGNVSSYTLAYKSTTGVGFYKYSASEFHANRAYLDERLLDGILPGTSTGQVKIVFDDEEDLSDNILELNGRIPDDVMYDIAGRKVDSDNTSAPGFYIKGGVKTLRR